MNKTQVKMRMRYTGQLILREVSKFDVDMSDFNAKNAQNSISAGSLPQTPLGELTALPDSIAVFKGTY